LGCKEKTIFLNKFYDNKLFKKCPFNDAYLHSYCNVKKKN